MGRSDLMTTDLAWAGSAAALADEIVALGQDRDVLRGAVTD